MTHVETRQNLYFSSAGKPARIRFRATEALPHPSAEYAIFPVHRARHREADPLVPGRPQGQRAQLPERGDDRRHPEVSAIMRETLICSVKSKFALFLCL